MSDIRVTVESGKPKRLLVEGKVCDKNIVVTATGGDSYYDAFWDAYQENGNKVNYSYTFAGLGWNDSTFKPKYDIRPTIVDSMFSACGITDLAKALEDCGVVLDISNANIESYFMHANNYTTTLPVLDCRGSTNLTYFLDFNNALRSVEKVILKDDGSQSFGNYSFGWLYALEEIRFEGCIGKNFMIVQSSLLSNASVQSIIDHLKDLTGQTSQTLTLHATVGGNMTAEQKAAITAKNWQLVY